MTQEEFLSLVLKDLERLGCCGLPVVVAVSGGADSICLLHTLDKLREKTEIVCVVAHANHHLRGVESDDDERFVASVSDQLGLACETGQLDVMAHVDGSGLGIEGAARELRYAFFADVARKHNASVVATAHSRDDNAETMLMHLSRGSGPRGLSGIPRERDMGSSVRVVRPFLSISRSVIREFASIWGVPWREDSSNESHQYLRNQVRSIIMPAMRQVFGPSIAERMLRSAELLREADSVIQSVVDEILPAIVTNDDQGQTTFAISALQNIPAGLIHAVFRSSLACTHTDVERLTNLIVAEKGSRAPLSDSREALRERDGIVVSRRTSYTNGLRVVIEHEGTYVADQQQLRVVRSQATDVVFRASQDIAYVDTSSVSGALVWRVWEDGDRFQPFGLDGTMLVSDLLTNLRIPHAHRKLTRVICDDQGIVWVCGARPAERTRITASTEYILILSCIP